MEDNTLLTNFQESAHIYLRILSAFNPIFRIPTAMAPEDTSSPSNPLGAVANKRCCELMII